MRLVPFVSVRREVLVGKFSNGSADGAVRVAVVGGCPVLVPHRVSEGHQVSKVVLVLIRRLRLHFDDRSLDGSNLEWTAVLGQDFGTVELPELGAAIRPGGRYEDLLAPCA